MLSSWIRLQNEPSFEVSVPTIDAEGDRRQPVMCQAKAVTELGIFNTSLDEIVIEFTAPSRFTRFEFVDQSFLKDENRDKGMVGLHLYFRSDLSQAERKLRALTSVLRDASPMPNAFRARRKSTSTQNSLVVKRSQLFNRDFWQGRGFWWSCSEAASLEHEGDIVSPKDDNPPTVIKPPSIALIDLEKPRLADAILASLLQKDQKRFQQYMSSALLGIAVITGGSSLVCQGCKY